MTHRALASCWSLTPDGIGAAVVSVEAHVARGLPSMGVIGLPGASIGEARWRVRSAIANAGLSWPQGRITIGLFPADLPKNGTGLDLAMAMALLAADGRASAVPPGTALIGELALNGAVRPVRAILAMVMQAVDAGFERIVVPAGCIQAAALVPGIEVLGVGSLGHALDLLAGRAAPVTAASRMPRIDREAAPDLRDVRGQATARFALEVMAAGGHHGLLLGDAGAGKTMLAERLPGLMPPLAPRESLEVTAIHASVRSGIDPDDVLVERPFIAPHHSASVAAITGGMRGSEVRPGAVTLAHRGVLFLDEAPEFARPALESLREPMESGTMAIARAGGMVRLPAACQVLLAANECPCGLGVRTGCTCSSMARRRYRERLSGPLLDRVDIRMLVERPCAADLTGPDPESTSAVQERVVRAATRMLERTGGVVNARVPAARLQGDLAVEPAAQAALLRLTAEGPRGIHRILRIAWTLADLAGCERPGTEQIDAAMSLRSGHGG